VGATGFEPVASSVSANHREPLCYTPFSQVGPNRRCGWETLSWRPVKRSLSNSNTALCSTRRSASSPRQPFHGGVHLHVCISLYPDGRSGGSSRPSTWTKVTATALSEAWQHQGSTLTDSRERPEDLVHNPAMMRRPAIGSGQDGTRRTERLRRSSGILSRARVVANRIGYLGVMPDRGWLVR
jgi:hypothetical protein